MSRRRVLKASLAVPFLLPARHILAQGSNQIVFANWGGDANKFFYEAFGKPFEDETRIKVTMDGSGPAAGKIRAMVQSNAVTWDICDSSLSNSVILGNQGLLSEIDYSVVDKAQFFPGMTLKYGVASYVFSNVIAYDSSKTGGRAPRGWKDFWDVKAFPGTRMMRKDLQGALEAALLADGVALNSIYPIDEERAFRKLAEIKPSTIFWSSASDSQQIMRDGEAVMGQMWSTRAAGVETDTKGRVKYVFDEGMMIPAAWVVPKNNPGGPNAQRFLRSMQDPKRQARLFELFRLAPVNPAAAEFISASGNAVNPVSNENRAKQFQINVDWYIANQARLEARFLNLVSG